MLKNTTKTIYIKYSPEKNETTFSGIKFVDFIESTPTPVENMLLLEHINLGSKYFHCFELLEGADDIANLESQNIHGYGNFCFVDYKESASVNRLSKEDIAELLYLSHMFEPLKSPFFDALQNSYAYLSHDDGWYCKLFCKGWDIPNSILINKLLNTVQQAFCSRTTSLPDGLSERITELSVKGLVVQIDILKQTKKAARADDQATIKLYDVGEIENMDNLFNNLEDIMSGKCRHRYTICS